MQAANHATAGTQQRYRNTFTALSEIWKSEGISGLTRGAKVACIRVGTGSSVQLTTYDTSKETLIQYIPYFQNPERRGIALHFLSSMISGLAVTTAMNPADVMTTPIYNQAAGSELYSSIPDCFVKILRTEGIAGFYKGWTAHYLRVGPHTILTFVFLEQLRKLFR